MWRLTFILIAFASCNAEEYSISTAKLSTSVDGRIIGGSATTIQQYPSTVQVLYQTRFLCGGILITQRHVLSAGHCFVDQNGYILDASLYSIRMGTNLLNIGGSLHLVSAVIVHELYNLPVRDNDVAVALLASAVTLSSSIAVANIPVAGAVVPDNSTVITVGWGLTDANVASSASLILNEVAVRTVNQATCFARYQSLQNSTSIPYPVTDSMICAGILDVGGKDACQGDSGGPLIYDNVVVGITSWGYGCAEPLYPGVYARVASYTNWINSTVRSQVGRYNAGSLSSKVGGITLLIPLLYTLLNV